MQGKRNIVGSLEDSMNFDYGSTSSNVGVDQQIRWNNFREPGNRDGINDTRWSIGESTSSNLQSVINHDEQTVHNGWSSSITSLGSGPRIQEQHHQPPIITSRNGFNLNLSMNQTASEPNLGQLPQVGSSSSEPFGSSSRTIGFSVAEDEGRSGFSLDGRRLPCKRKTTEENLGQSSNGGSAWPAFPGYGHQDFSSINTGLDLSMNHNPSNTFLPINDRHDSSLPRLQRNPQHAQWSRSEPQDLNSRPLFMPSGEVRSNAALFHANWSLSSGGSGGGSMAGPGLVSSRRRSPSQYPSRLSDHVRGSVSSVGGHGGFDPENNFIASSPNVVGLPSGGGGGQRLIQLLSRATPWREGNRDGILVTRSRGLSVGGAGRNRLVSEVSLVSISRVGGLISHNLPVSRDRHIRNVLHIMQRGEGLQFEDMMALDPSVFFGMADIHDRHRDMRLDVDNMSYEELLALEERIGDVCTGVSAETIATRMKRGKFSSATTDDGTEIEPCCICQEEFGEGEDLGTLDCGHDFHSECIRRWLEQKNLCPICKTTALST